MLHNKYITDNKRGDLLNRRVVVTGLGMVTPVGLDVKTSWDALVAGKSGVARISRFDASDFAVQIAAEVKDFRPEVCLDPRDIKKSELFIQYAAVAAHEALLDSKLTIDEKTSERIGVSIGSGIGGLSSIERTFATYSEQGPRKILPSFIPYTIINMVPGFVAIKEGCRGPNLSMVSACSTGAHNIGNAARLISWGDADLMLAGGSEMATTPLGIGGFAALKALSRRSDDPEAASRPWDRDRDGFVLGEGAGVMLLEEYEHAKARGAKIYAELTGYGASDDAYHITMPDPSGRGAMLAMQQALKDAKLDVNGVDYINAHATSTAAGDVAELNAIMQLFGDHAHRGLMISGTKSMTGHMLGAAGAVEAIISVLAIEHQIVPPTINLEHPDQDWGVDLVPNQARSSKVQVALSNSFGFGGTNACLIFSKM